MQGLHSIYSPEAQREDFWPHDLTQPKGSLFQNSTQTRATYQKATPLLGAIYKLVHVPDARNNRDTPLRCPAPCSSQARGLCLAVSSRRSPQLPTREGWMVPLRDASLLSVQIRCHIECAPCSPIVSNYGFLNSTTRTEFVRPPFPGLVPCWRCPGRWCPLRYSGCGFEFKVSRCCPCTGCVLAVLVQCPVFRWTFGGVAMVFPVAQRCPVCVLGRVLVGCVSGASRWCSDTTATSPGIHRNSETPARHNRNTTKTLSKHNQHTHSDRTPN